LRRDLDLRTVVVSAALILAILLPPVQIVRALKSNDAPYEESFLWVVPVVFILIGFPVGGWFAGRRRPRSALLHGAAAAFLAYLLTVGVAIIRLIVSGDGLKGSTLVSMLLYLQIAVSLGTLGGYLAGRGLRRTGRSQA
jgi:putative membrane protein (TIGR04086 family)